LGGLDAPPGHDAPGPPEGTGPQGERADSERLEACRLTADDGLAGAGRPDQPHRLARRDAQVQPVDGLHRPSVHVEGRVEVREPEQVVDVTVLDGGTADGRRGLDLVVPGDEFERLTEAVADRSFGSADVFGTPLAASSSSWRC
jgi:hypothetical protein